MQVIEFGMHFRNWSAFRKQKVTIGNLSAAVTGVLLALVLTPAIPLWMVVIGAVVAMILGERSVFHILSSYVCLMLVVYCIAYAVLSRKY